MINSFFLIAMRNIRRHFSYALLNILGLTLGIATSIIIFLVVRNELSFDQYHQKANRIWRVTLNAIDFNPSVSMAITPALRADYPELEVTQVWYQPDGVIKLGDKRYNEKGGFCYVDEHFMNVFDHQWLAGDKRTALSAPNTVVLTESMAHKYFGKDEAMGKLLKLGNDDITVTGIIKDPPPNTHLPFRFLVSFETVRKRIKPEQLEFYDIMGGFTYFAAPENFDVKKLQAQVPAFITRHWGKELAKEARLPLQPLP